VHTLAAVVVEIVIIPLYILPILAVVVAVLPEPVAMLLEAGLVAAAVQGTEADRVAVELAVITPDQAAGHVRQVEHLETADLVL
jgi:hypothetical protein